MTVPLGDHSAVHVMGSIGSDVLLKGEVFAWELSVVFNNKEIVVNLQAGKIKIEVEGNK